MLSGIQLICSDYSTSTQYGGGDTVIDDNIVPRQPVGIHKLFMRHDYVNAIGYADGKLGGGSGGRPSEITLPSNCG